MTLKKYLVKLGETEYIYWLDDLTLKQGYSVRFTDSSAWYKIMESYSSVKEGVPDRKILRVMRH